MSSRQHRAVWAAAGAAVIGASLLAASPWRTRAAQKPSSETAASSDFVTYDAGFSRWLNAPKTVEMSQGVTLNQEDTYLKTDSAIVNLDNEQRALNAKSLAPVHVYDPQSDLNGKNGFIDFTRHLATMRDNVVLVVKPSDKDAGAPKASLRSRFKDAATMTCEMMTYDYRKKIGTVPGPLTVNQKNRVLTADSGRYDGIAKQITLVGNVRAKDTNGNVIKASKVIIGVQENDESVTIPAPTHGVFKTKKAEDVTAPEDTSDTGTLPPMPVTPPPPTSSGPPPAKSPDPAPTPTTDAPVGNGE
jgi:lipopolysaccharide assembly outer membrane protein LptD (OstA)